MKGTLIINILCSISLTCASQITQFGGPDRNQVYDETGLLNEWPKEGHELLATLSGIGAGYHPGHQPVPCKVRNR